MAIIQFKDVWEMFRIKFIIDGKVSWENFWALKGVNLNIEKGETLGIIGENGAGKSTILKLIAGMLKPDRGEIKVSGRVSGLLELGAGFQPELTGRENVYLSAGLFGLTQSQIEEKYEEIINFANIGKFINAPVKCYSQGMFVRLAFAIAIHVNPDILLIDDTLAVGDEHFQRKCIKKIFEIKEQGKTIIFVTHDMNMLRRLCERAIFLKEGRIVKDDFIDKVVPLYTQMIGTKEGVGILEKSPLNLIFNNGRFFLNWQDKLLTPNSGAYAVFRMADKWYSSLQADWEVKREGENELVATGKFYQLALTQIWRLELTDNYTVKWDIDIGSEEPLEIQEGLTNIMLTNEYTNWFTPLEKGEFPLIDEKNKNWQVLLEDNIFRKCIGIIEAKENLGNKIPSLAFEQSNYIPATYAQILNSDYLNNCRILQYKTFGLQNYLVTPINRFTFFSGKIIFNTLDIDNYLRNLEDEFVLSNGKLRLTFDNGECILCYNGVNLTKSNHICTSIFANGRWYLSNLAHWEVKKKKKNKLVAKGNWSNLPLTQIWEIEITSESSYLLKINLQVDKEVVIEEQQVRFMCREDYKYWFSEYGAGEFPKEFSEVPMDVLQRCIPDGAIGFQSQSGKLPFLSLKFSKDLNNFARISNSDFYNKARMLLIEKVESEKDVRFLAGQYSCFKIDVILNGDKQLYIGDSVNVLQDRKLRFVFDRGRGRIYYNGIELTKRLGLYTSLRSGGYWYDSATSSIWKIEQKNIDSLRTVVKWLDLPIIQYWEIKLKENGLVEFNIKMEVERAIEADRLQTNLMLSERYLKWKTENENGTFPLFKEDIDDDWDCICSLAATSKYIGVLENLEDNNSLPSILFTPKVLNSECCLNIVNSNMYFRGRVLQYLYAKRTQISPGQYDYFNGNIIIKS